MLTTRNLTKQYAGGKGFRDVSLDCEAGRVVSVYGLNGSGKSSFLKVVGGFLAPTSGMVRVAGLDVLQNADRVRASVSYLPEDTGLYSAMTVAEYIDLFCKLRGYGEAVHREIARELAERLELGQHFDVRTSSLSKGMKRKLLFVMACIGDAQIYLLDEPFDGVDEPSRRIMGDEIVRRARRGALVLCADHNIEFSGGFVDEYLVFRNGQLIDHEDVRHLDDSGRVALPGRIAARMASATLSGS